VKRLKEQLRVSITMQRESSQDVNPTQAAKFSQASESVASASSAAQPVAIDLSNLPFDPDKEAVQHAREIVMRVHKDQISST
jgi:hypothetical protein